MSEIVLCFLGPLVKLVEKWFEYWLLQFEDKRNQGGNHFFFSAAHIVLVEVLKLKIRFGLCTWFVAENYLPRILIS